MKNKLIIAIIALMAFALSAGIAGAAAKADFSGEWTLDAGKSEGLPPGVGSTMIVKQTGDRLEVETKLQMGASETRTIKDVFVLDGKETDFVPPLIAGDANVKQAKRTSKWMTDENGFDSTEEAVLILPEGEEDKIKVTRRWTLSADGKTLIAETTMQSQNVTSKTKRVFVKK